VRVSRRVSSPPRRSHLGYVLLAPDQRSGLEGEVVAVSVQRPQGRELRRQFRGKELVHPLWPEEVFETMLSEVSETRPCRKLIAHQLLGREREQHLPTVGCGKQPRYPVYRRTEVVPIALLCGSCVQSHPHPKRSDVLPFGREESTLALQGGFQGIRGSREGTTEGVTDRLEDVATVLLCGTP